MGSNIKATEQPPHRVQIEHPFYIGTTEVTQGQWQAVMGNNPSNFKGEDSLPVEQVSWEDCQSFLQKLSQKEGKEYRLPSEAEWEYACRAGSTTRYFYGDEESKLGEYAWYQDNSGNMTQPVGQKKPNAWGLYDIYGNVGEWCQDWYIAYPGNSQPHFDYGTKFRINRGSTFGFPIDYFGSVNRYRVQPTVRRNNFGLRVVRTP